MGSNNIWCKFFFAVKKFYDAISYVPRNTTRCRSELKLTDSIELASPCVKLFSSMQKAKEELYPTRTSFIHADGMPWTTTIKCLISTWNSWKALQKRLEFFDQNLVTQVDPHTITNESLIEHGFGSQKSRGQGNLQNPQEYIQTKRLKGVDFHLKMCQMPFNQHSLSKKIVDKSYQEMDQRYLKVSFKEL